VLSALRHAKHDLGDRATLLKTDTYTDALERDSAGSSRQTDVLGLLVFPIPIRRGFSHSPLLSTQMAYPSAAVPAELGVEKNTTVVFPAPMMSAIGEISSFLSRESAASKELTPPLAPPGTLGAGPTG
jgi:hypothetical protein